MTRAQNALNPAKLTPNLGLKDRNTFGLDAVAELAYEITSAGQIPEVMSEIAKQKMSWRVLGGGSNVILPNTLAGATLLMNILGQEIIKTDQERIQNIGSNLRFYVGKTFEITEKLHGSSCQFYLDNTNDFHVCSRNLDLKFDENNSFWKAAIKYDVESKMKNAQMQGISIGGELIGQGINGNQYGVDLEFHVFDMYNVNTCEYAPSFNRQQIAAYLGLQHVPVLDTVVLQSDDTVEGILGSSEFNSLLNGSQAEGCVWKCIEEPSISFKAVSNTWLLKND